MLSESKYMYSERYKPEPLVAVLAFHKVGSPWQGANTNWYYVTESALEAYLKTLTSLRWEVIDLQMFLRGLEDPGTLPPRSALITFDDGYRCVLSNAWPVLKRRNCPAVIFVPPMFVGGLNDFDRGKQPEEPICTWDDLRRLQDAGISVQSHGLSHRNFSRISVAEQRFELEHSKEILTASLGTEVQAIAYPYGNMGHDPESLMNMLQETGYRAGFEYHGSAFPVRGSNPYRLPRIAMGPDTDLQTMLLAHADSLK